MVWRVWTYKLACIFLAILIAITPITISPKPASAVSNIVNALGVKPPVVGRPVGAVEASRGCDVESECED